MVYDLTFLLLIIILILWAFLSGVVFIYMKSLEQKLAVFEKREEMIQKIVEEKLKGEDYEED